MASLEEGRTPLTLDAQEPSTQDLAIMALFRKAGRWRCMLVFLLLVDLVAIPCLALAPFSFDANRWYNSQVAGWSTEFSLADWVVAAMLRDFLVLVLAQCCRGREEQKSARRARRAATAMFLYSICRITMLDIKALGAAASVPVLAASALLTPLIPLVAHRHFLMLRRAVTARSEAEEAQQAPAENASSPPEEQQYSSELTFLQTLHLLKPYFWPSTGKRWVVFMNRVRALSTWGCVGLSKTFNIISPLFLAHATNCVSASLKKGPGQIITTEIIVSISIYAALIFLSRMLKEFQSLVYIKVQQAAYIEIADTTFAHLHSLSLDWHLKKKMGNVITSMKRGIEAAQQTMQYIVLYLFPTLCEAFAVCLIFVFHFQSVRLAVFTGMTLYVYTYVTVKLTVWRKKFRTGTTKKDNEMQDRITDSLINYETVKYFTAEEYERREYRNVVQKYQEYSMATQASLSILNILQQVVVNFALAGGMIIAAMQLLNREGGLGDFVAVNAYMLNIFAPLSFLGTIYNMVINAMVDMKNFGQLRAEKSAVQDLPNAPDLNLRVRDGVPMVEYRNVCFQYARQATQNSLRDVSFEVPLGSTMALVGQTGAGKTTITRLLFRFYDPTSGMVLLNAQDVRKLTQRSVRNAIGMVPQDVVMFNDTIAHNIRYGQIDTAKQEDIERAAEKAQLAGFITQQERGYNTVVGERGLKLSGGEKQRLAIARCFVKDPPIVVLDEATSALDSQTEQLVQDALQELSNRRTVIAIAHRLSTIRHFDQILVLQKGVILERGTHETLLATENSKYAEMWNRQLHGLTDDQSSPSASPSTSTGGRGLSSSETDGPGPAAPRQ